MGLIPSKDESANVDVDVDHGASDAGSLDRRLTQATSALADRERRLWQATTALERLEGDLQAIGRSRAWRWGHGVSRVLRRLTLRAPVGEGAVAAAMKRIAMLRADGVLAPPAVPGDVVAEEPPTAPDRAPSPAAASRPAIGGGLPATTVIAVHNACEETERCIESVLAHTRPVHRVVLIDDASTDARIRPLLASYDERFDNVEALFHDTNRGYTATINHGCELAEGDVVLLNSDTEVTPGWLEKLASVAYSRHDVATVTPVSNAAGVFSIPKLNCNDGLPDGVTASMMAALVERVSPRTRPPVPTGNGFCMYVRRSALDAIGGFDESAFPRGYGEENDFCQRAARTGFVNLADDATFIYHKRSASFGASKAAVLEAAREQLNGMHPGYKAEAMRFIADDPLRELRGAVGAALAKGPDEVRRLPRSRATVLIILHSGEGGTPATTRDLATSLSARFRCLQLRCDWSTWVLEEFLPGGIATPLATFEFDDTRRTTDSFDGERAQALERICREQRVALVHLRSFITLGPEVVDAVKAMDLPIAVSLHDFFAVCPTIQLLDEHGRYCGGHCTSGQGPCPTSKRWVLGVPELKHGYVNRWRTRVGESLRHADAFITTSAAARDVLVDHFPFMDDGRLELIEHGRDVGAFEWLGEPPSAIPRVACFGALGVAKGIGLIEAILALDRRVGPRFEFHFFGNRHRDFAPERFGGIHHGSYERDELPGLLASVRPSYALVSSIWPETYCHTLTEAWMTGLPVFASDLGTLHERIRRHGGGWLLEHTDPEAFYRGMCRIDDNREEWHLRRREIERIPPRTVDRMGGDYRDLYQRLISSSATAREGSVADGNAGPARVTAQDAAGA